MLNLYTLYVIRDAAIILSHVYTYARTHTHTHTHTDTHHTIIHTHHAHARTQHTHARAGLQELVATGKAEKLKGFELVKKVHLEAE